MTYRLFAIIISLLSPVAASRDAQAQYFTRGDTLVLTYQGGSRLPYYRKVGDSVEYVGYLESASHKDDSLLVIGEWADLYVEVVLEGDTIIVGGMTSGQMTTSVRKVREAQMEEKMRAEWERRAAIEEEERVLKRAMFFEELRARNVPLTMRLRFDVNSAGGVEPLVFINNISPSRRLKYINVVIAPFNSVGDPVRAELSSKTQHTLRLIGPIEPQNSGAYDYDGDPVFYASTTDCIEVHRVEIDFMDGGRFVMVNDLEAARENRDDYNLRGDCRDR
jgi:hypothetical protein